MPIASLRHDEENPDWHRSNPLVNKTQVRYLGNTRREGSILTMNQESRVRLPLAAAITSMSYSHLFNSELQFPLINKQELRLEQPFLNQGECKWLTLQNE